MSVLVDSCVWIDYFRNGANSEKLEWLIEKNLVVINEIILAELVPFLKIKKQKRLIKLLYKIEKLKMEIDWQDLIKTQFNCLKKGINGVGLTDLIIAQNAKQQGSEIYSLDRHFQTLKTL